MVVTTTTSRSGYPGGKGKSFQHVINVMPPHTRYIETHLGAGAIMRRKRPAKRNIGIEIDERVVEHWRNEAVGGVEVILGDAITVLRSLAPTSEDLIYSDPPFVLDTRKVRCYRHEYTQVDHERLLEVLLSTPAHVVISGYRSDLYDTRLRDWHRKDYSCRTRRGSAIESLWTNFRPGANLHDYSFVGNDFRERERLRRRIRALTSRLMRATEIERNAALSALAARRTLPSVPERTR